METGLESSLAALRQSADENKAMDGRELVKTTTVQVVDYTDVETCTASDDEGVVCTLSAMCVVLGVV